jgi:hypothetical protein
MNKTLEPLENNPMGPFSKRAVSLGRQVMRENNSKKRDLKLDL